MPLYDYKCDNCKNILHDIKQSIKDKPLKKCQMCGKNKLQRVIFPPLCVSIRGDVNTIGQLAESNTKKMGKTKLQEIEAKRPKDEGKEKRDLHRKINKMTPEQQKRYIENG